MSDKADLCASDADAFIASVDDYTELSRDAVQSDQQLVIDWGRKGVGFGMLMFYERDGALGCDNEGMGRAFCKGVLMALAESLGYAPMPPMLLRFTGDTYEERIDKLLDACPPRHGKEGGGW